MNKLAIVPLKGFNLGEAGVQILSKVTPDI